MVSVVSLESYVVPFLPLPAVGAEVGALPLAPQQLSRPLSGAAAEVSGAPWDARDEPPRKVGY